MKERREFQVRTERIEELVRTLEAADDPKLHAIAMELVQSVMELHGAGLQKMLEIVSEGPNGDFEIDQFIADDLISSLLLLHELHPDEMETRVLHALEKLRPSLQSHGGEVELVSIEGGVIRLRIHGSSEGGCHSSSPAMLKSQIEDAIWQAAPDALQIASEEVERPRPVQLVTLK